MKYGQNICHREGCGYDLSGLDFDGGEVYCPECGALNTNRILSPFPGLMTYMLSVSKPWLWGLPAGLTLSFLCTFLLQLFWLPGLLLSAGILISLYVVIVLRSRKRVMLDVEFGETVPDWAWNGFFMPTAIWTTFYWCGITVVWSV